MNSQRFPVGIVVTLGILWLGLVGVTVWGWYAVSSARVSLQQGVTAGVSDTSSSPGPGGGDATGSPPSSALARPHTLVWTQDGLWRFVYHAGGAALVDVLFLFLAIGAGISVQDKSERVQE